MVVNEKLSKHRFQNLVQSALIIALMAILLSICAYIILGDIAFYIVLIGSVFYLTIQPQLPTWFVMKLYRASPVSNWDAPELIQIVNTLSIKANLDSKPSLYYVPSSSMNAFTTGSAHDSAIAVSDGLLRRLTLYELAAVIAHEIAHIKNRDIQVMSLADTVSRLTIVLAQFGLLLLLFSIALWLFGVVEISLLAIIILLSAPLLIALLQASLSRTREFAADLGAAELTGDPETLASALLKIERPQQGWFHRLLLPQETENNPSLLRSHPPTKERIQRLLQLSHPVARQPELMDSYSVTQIPKVRYIVITNRPRRHWSGLWY